MGLIVSYGATVAAFLYRRLQRGAALAALLLLPSVSACGGSGQPVPGTLPQHASAPLAPDAAMRETQSESALMPAAPFVAGPNDLLYVANAGNNSITVYHTGASGNTAPLATIEGSKTGLESPGQLSEDQNGNLYVANQYHAEPPESILVFKHGANGNVAPIRAIAGPATRLSTNDLAAIAVDPAGRIFATMGLPSDEGSADLVRFAPDASGNVAPLATSRGGEDLDDANELAFDSTGKNIIEANGPVCCEVFSEGVNTYSKQFPNGKNASLIYSISAFTSNGIADDPTTKTYLVSGGDGVSQGIFRFDENTVGHGANSGEGTPQYTPAAVSVITSDTCGTQLALGYERNIYVLHSTFAGSCRTDAVYVYEHDASGKAAPLRVLTGSATDLDQPTGIYEGK